ncbi:MAG: hypothetical protein HKN99_06940 [Winogradskyella sp.]|nr:hypothetical protein [Winogradskyella sp.]
MKVSSIIKLCAFTVFIGRAYQFYFFGAPFRAILWDESLLSPIIEGLFNYKWYDYATSVTVNQWIDRFTKATAVLFAIVSVVCLFWDKIKFRLVKRYILGAALFMMFILGICIIKDRSYDVLPFFELSMQFAAPLLLFVFSDLALLNSKKVVLFLKITIALTFIPHGIYAMGVLFVPGHFIDMTIKILNVNEDQATLFLFVVGFLDVLLSLLLFVPKISKYVLYYMIFWGFITAFARVASGFSINFVWSSLHNVMYLTVYRLAHGLIPLATLISEQKIIKKTLNYSIK